MTPNDPSGRPTPKVDALGDRIRKDAPVSRRDYLRILVTVSGGLLVGTVAVALGAFRRAKSGPGTAQHIADSLAPGKSLAFAYPTKEDPAIAIRMLDGTLVAYSSVCTHLSCAVLWHAEERALGCPCHDGEFDPTNGDVVAGPPPRPLPRILLEERPDGIYAVGMVIR